MIVLQKLFNKFSEWDSQTNSPFFYIAFALAFRVVSFPALLIDNDEWTYWQMAIEWLRGGALYVDIKDIKPPGIFIVFATLIKLSFSKIYLARIWATILLGTAAWWTTRIANSIFSISTKVSGLIFLLAFNYWFGMALNTELFFVSFSIIGFGMVVTLKSKIYQVIGALLMGFAFCIKYAVAVDIGMALLFYISINSSEKKNSGKSIRNSFLLGFISIVPFALLHLAFYLSGNLSAFTQVIYELPGRYIIDRNWPVTLDTFAIYHFRFIWFVLAAYIGIYHLSKRSKHMAFLMMLWILGIWFFILMPSRLHDHYWLHLSLPMSIGAGFFLQNWRHSNIVTPIFIIVFWVFMTFSIGKKVYWVNDSIINVNKGVNVKSGEIIWAANSPSVYYYLNDSRCPTPYVHGSLSFDQGHLHVFGEVQTELWVRILENCDKVVFTHGTEHDDDFLKLLNLTFEKQWESGNTHSVWKKTDKSQLKD